MMKGVLLLLIAILAVASSSSSCHALATAHSSSSISGNRFLHTNDENKQYRLLTSVRGGDVLTVPRTAPASTSASSKSSTAAGSGGLTTTALQATATAAETAPINTRQRYWRIARELGNHVWPKVPPKAQKKQSSDMAADQVNGDSSATHANHISAAENKKDRRQALSIRYRVVASILLMLAGKGVTIATPFLFKMLVDIVPSYAEGVATSTVKSLPILLLLAYGTCRSLSSLFREMTNAIFAHVAQSAIRRFGRSTFDHVHSLDLQYHLNRNTGALGRVLERGSRSISFALNALVFNTIPTLLEVSIVMGIMFRKFGVWEAVTVAMTMEVATTLFGLGICCAAINETPKAMECYNRALEISAFDGSNPKLEAQALHQIGCVHALTCSYRDALQSWRTSLSKYREAGLADDHYMVACTLGNIEMAENVLSSG